MSVALIKRLTAEHYGVALTAINGRYNNRRASEARHVAMYLTRTMLELPYSQIARKFNKDHSSVIYGVNKITWRCIHDDEYWAIVYHIKQAAESMIQLGKTLSNVRKQKISHGHKRSVSA